MKKERMDEKMKKVRENKKMKEKNRKENIFF